MLAAISTLGAAAPAQNYFSDLQYSGFLDLYYQYSNQKPDPSFLAFRNFDVRHSRLQVAAAQFNIFKPTSAKYPLGFTLQLAAGKNQDIQTLGEVDSDLSRPFQQAFLTYTVPNSGGTTVDFGKFTTWIGAESLFAMNNDLYSLSFLFTLGQPSYHLGLRATRPFGATTLALYGVNGWNEVHDSNGGKSYGATLSQTFGKTAVTLNYYGGDEGADKKNGAYVASIGGTSNLQLADLVVVTNPTADLKLTLNADYGSAKARGGSVADGKWSGYNVTARYKLDGVTKGLSVSGRYDNFFDPDGARTLFLQGARFNSGVLGVEYASGKHSILRLEARHDLSNRDAFEGEDGLGTRKSRTTFTIAHILKF